MFVCVSFVCDLWIYVSAEGSSCLKGNSTVDGTWPWSSCAYHEYVLPGRVRASISRSSIVKANQYKIFLLCLKEMCSGNEAMR